MTQDFRDLLAAFIEAGVRFLVVGAHALAAHGVPRVTGDLVISGVAFEEAWAERMEGTLYDVGVPFIGREAFIRNKRASGRPKDLEDVRSLKG